jgi:putative PIG3 family NAD(P)H quinone oxidoreductase
MKAVVLDGFGGPEVMRLGEVDAPAPGPGQIRIRVVATSVNRPDIIQRQGNYPPPPGESEVLGLEVAGTVDALGPGVTDFALGERVFALVGGGAYAELATAHAGHVLRIPAGLSFEQAACIAETYITAYMNLFRGARLMDGESVLLHGGGGGVNTAAIQLVATLAPASRIFVTASTAKLERVAALGADVVIDYRQEAFAKIVARETDGRGVDVILDHIGADYFVPNLRSLGVNGRLVVIATMSGREATLDLGRLMVKRQTIMGSVLRPRPVAEKAAIIADFAAAVLPRFASGEIVPLVHTVLPIADVVAAHELMEASGHFGKIVLRLTDAD